MSPRLRLALWCLPVLVAAGYALAQGTQFGDAVVVQSSSTAPVVITARTQDKAAFGELRVAQDTPEVNLLFSNNVNPALVDTLTTVGAATLTQANGMMVLQSGATSTGQMKVASTASAQYLPGQGLLARFTAVFTPCVAQSYQEIGLFNPATNDAAMFGCSGATFGIIHRVGSADAGYAESFIPQTRWSEDRLDGTGPSGVTLDITLGAIYIVQMQYLGFGPLRYYASNPKTGDFVLVHVESWGGSLASGGGGKATPSFSNPTFGLGARVVNTGNTTNLTLKTASMALTREGPDGHSGPTGGAANRKASISAATSLFAIKVKTAFGPASLPSEVRIRLADLTYYTGTDSRVDLILNPTLGGSPSYADFSTTTSVVQIDTAGTTVTGGRVLFSAVGNNNFVVPVDLWERHMELNPGDVLAVTVTPLSGTPTAGAALNWQEEF